MQTLSWQPGDRYRTEDGTVMEIREVTDGLSICLVEGRMHCFDPLGNHLRSGCCHLCTHGNLMSRISGSVEA